MNNNSVVNIDDRRRKTNITDWGKEVDWRQKSNGQVAEELRISESYVSRMRCEHAPDTRHHVWGGGVDWAGVDWRGKRNKEIALDTHKSESAVSKRRAEYAPETVQVKTDYSARGLAVKVLQPTAFLH